jgi:hypothetical protein
MATTGVQLSARMKTRATTDAMGRQPLLLRTADDRRSESDGPGARSAQPADASVYRPNARIAASG